MKSNGSMNRLYRVVWNATKAVWQAVGEVGGSHGKEKPARKMRRAAVASGLLLVGGAALAAPAATELPGGGVVVGGSATISTSGARMDILQTTQRTAIDWNTFNIGSAAHVHFEQPVGGAALNRVLDTNASQIYGRLTSTGQVFLVNPNGVFFAPGAQVDVGSLVASTLSLDPAAFMNGSTTFSGSSSNAIINQGNITAANGGTIALIAARITNEGTLTANGGNVLLGAGSKVTLDMGGPVKLQIENDTLETLIQNGGAIKADGGQVLLTSQAAATLASSVINNTGLIEAQTLSTGEKGEIILFAHGGVANVAGKLDASAPNGGDGGFIETSGLKVSLADSLRVSTLASQGDTGLWLIDPATYTVAASGGDETGAALAGRLAGTNIQIQADNTITISDAVTWSANKLTLTSGGNINVAASLTATGTGSLAFEYGQGSADGAGSTYTVTNGAKILIPQATAFTWKKGSGGTLTNLVFDNGNLRFGNGTQASLNSNGLLEQPWYFDNTSVVGGVQRNAWYKLTFSNFALNLEVGAGGDGTDSWNRNGSLLNSQTNLAAAISGRQFDITGYKEGAGVIVSSVNLAFTGGEAVRVDNTYTLAANASFVKIDTNLTNIGASAANNLRLWVGTQDDYVATRDSQYKYKGNLTANGFEQIATQDTQAKALKVTEFATNEGAAILFYSTSSGADTSIAQCCSFSNATGIDPRTSPIWRGPEDGSYALFIRLPNLAQGQTDGMTWYYAAAPAASINDVVTTVAQSAGVSAPPPAPTANTIPVDAAIKIAQSLPVEPITNTSTIVGTPPATTPPPVSVMLPQQGSLPVVGLSGGLAFVQVNAPAGGANPPEQGALPGSTGPAAAGTPDEATTSSAPRGNSGGDTVPAGRDPMGFMRVFVVEGGLNLPDVALNAAGSAPGSANPQDNQNSQDRDNAAQQ
jgi:filamentous hemagglutinin family protein